MSTAGYLSLTQADREAMLEAIGVESIDELFEQIPAGVRFGRELDVPAALPEADARAAPGGARGEERGHDARAELPRHGDLRPLRAGDRRHVPLARRAPHGVHAVPAGDEPGRPAGDLRVPDRDLRADRDGRLERLGLRRHDRRGRRLLHRASPHRPHEGRAGRDAQPAGAPGGEDVRAGLRHGGRRGAARRRHDRSGARSRPRRRTRRP